MQSPFKLALRLMVFALASGLVLSLTNVLTAEPIRRQEILVANMSRAAAFPEADDFIKVEGEIPKSYAGLNEVYQVKREGALIGYALSMSVYGYQGDIVMTLGVGVDGTMRSLQINSQTETTGLGSLISEQPFLSHFVDIPATSQAVQGIDAITGATVSSSAVINAVEHAVDYYNDHLHAAGD